MDMPAPKYNWTQKVLAWGVHVFTAFGIIPALLALISVSAEDWRMAYLWLFVALVIDGIDGTLARRIKVDRILPEVNGKMIDTVIDFTTYAIIPAYFFYQAGLGPPGWNLIAAALMLLAATLYYGKEGMIAESMHFVGFPVLWNVVVFFLFFVLQWPPWMNLAAVLLFSILHFIPLRYAYPSRSTRWQTLTILMSVLGLLASLALIWQYPASSGWLKGIILTSLAYFVILVIVDSFHYRS